MTTESAAIVVVTYNRADLLERMLEGLTTLDPAPDAVIVVDNASTDRTRAVLEARRRAGDPQRRRTSAGRAGSTWVCRPPTSRATTGSG